MVSDDPNRSFGNLSFDHLVGAQQEFPADRQAERSRCLEIHHEVELARLLDR
jgi:hypothetical protein